LKTDVKKPATSVYGMQEKQEVLGRTSHLFFLDTSQTAQRVTRQIFPVFFFPCIFVRRYSSHYGDRLRTHPSHLAVNLLRLPDNRRLRRFLPTDLPDRF
jgi:hypothetical protein